MGLITRLLDFLFAEGPTALRQTVETFRPNAEAEAARGQALRRATLHQFEQEFLPEGRGRFDRGVDALNRLPRPGLAFGTLALFGAAMVDPVWFAARMQGLSLVPEPLWWLLGVVVSFYFGARHQLKSQEFQYSMRQSLERLPEVLEGLDRLSQLQRQGGDGTGQAAELNAEVLLPEHNAALDAWRLAKRADKPATM